MALKAKELNFKTIEITPGIGQINVFQLSGQKELPVLKNGDHVSLRAEGIYGDYPDININDSMEFEVWGVVTHTIHNNR